MFGWIDRLVASIYRRGQSLVEASDRALDERRAAVRGVRENVSQAMTYAEFDRMHGKDLERANAIAAAIRAASTVHEVADDEARRLVTEWKAKFDAIPKGWKEGGPANTYSDERKPRGYPEAEWNDLRAAADAAVERLGAVLRDLLDPKR